MQLPLPANLAILFKPTDINSLYRKLIRYIQPFCSSFLNSVCWVFIYPMLEFVYDSNPWENGLRLALLNVALAVFCIVSFLGTLLVVTSLNRLNPNRVGSPFSEVPVPYPLLLLLYAIMFLISWVRFGHRLPYAGRARFRTALVGTGPLFGLSLLGYIAAVGALISDEIPAASFFVFGGLLTLILLAGIACVCLICLCGANKMTASTKGA